MSLCPEESTIEDLIKSSLASIGKEFEPDELAYLALTTKIELPLRDRWAFALYSVLSSSFLVAREWRRTDLAIIKDGTPQVLIEMKAMYTFDAALDQQSIGGFCDAMEKDEEKAKSLAGESAEIYTVLLATHPFSEIPKTHDRVIKYMQGINKAIHLMSEARTVANTATAAVNAKLSCKNVIASGSINGGSAFGIETEVFYWLVKA